MGVDCRSDGPFVPGLTGPPQPREFSRATRLGVDLEVVAPLEQREGRLQVSAAAVEFDQDGEGEVGRGHPRPPQRRRNPVEF